MATLPTRSAITSSSTTNAQQKVNFGDQRDFIAELLGTDSSDKAAARALLGSASYGSVKRLSGNNNPSFAATRFDLQAEAVLLRNATGGMVARFNTGTLTCNFGTAGSAANGRDQSGAFTASNWVYLYFIWDGTTLATLASLTAPASFTGSSLPTGYTHWAFATAVYWNSISNIVQSWVRGKGVWYQTPGVVINAGVATGETSIDLTTAMPPNALTVMGHALMQNVSAVADSWYGIIRFLTGQDALTITLGVSGSGLIAAQQMPFDLPNQNQNLFYILETGTTQMTVTITGYTVANGDS